MCKKVLNITSHQKCKLKSLGEITEKEGELVAFLTAMNREEPLKGGKMSFSFSSWWGKLGSGKRRLQSALSPSSGS